MCFAISLSVFCPLSPTQRTPPAPDQMGPKTSPCLRPQVSRNLVHARQATHYTVVILQRL